MTTLADLTVMGHRQTKMVEEGWSGWSWVAVQLEPSSEAQLRLLACEYVLLPVLESVLTAIPTEPCRPRHLSALVLL